MLADAVVKGTHSTQHRLASLADPGFADGNMLSLSPFHHFLPHFSITLLLALDLASYTILLQYFGHRFNVILLSSL